MKTFVRFAPLVLAFAVAAGCQKISQNKVYTANVPIYMTYDELRASIGNQDLDVVENPGKIFLHNQYILVNDLSKGVHVYDNSNPSNPQHVAFINIPGNVDMAVKDNTLYADSYVDVVAIDISNPQHATEIGRSMNALSYTIPATMNLDYPVYGVDETKGVVLDYRVEEVEENCKNTDCSFRYYDAWIVDNGDWGGSMMSEDGQAVSFAGTNNNVVRSAAASSETNIAGSMARFLMIDGMLYTIADENTVKVFDVNGGNISMVDEFQPWTDANTWNGGQIETLFSLNNNLFIGSNAGMLVYNVENASTPEYVSNYSHLTSCDPVVATESHAFVTLRDGNGCGMDGVNQLDVVDIEDIFNPFVMRSYEMTNPHGLSIDDNNNLLFVCDGSAGLKVFDASQADELKHLGTTDGETYDVITFNETAYVIGNGSLIQYGYDAQGNLSEKSQLLFN